MPLFVSATVAAFYVLALVLDRSAGIVYGVLVLLGVVGAMAGRHVHDESFLRIIRRYWPLSLALAGPLLADVAHQLATGNFYGRSLDQAARLALFPFAFFAVWLVPLKYLRHLQWAFVLGAFSAAIKMHVLTQGGTVQYGTDFIPIGIFAEMAMLVGLYAAYSIAWKPEQSRPAALLKLLACCAVAYAAYLSHERGVWLTLIAFGAIAFGFVTYLDWRRKTLILALVLAGAALAVQGDTQVRQRFERAWHEVEMYRQGKDVDTSVGVRLQLWRGSLILFRENPVLGVGAGEYRAALNGLVARKIISSAAASHPHSHNEILFAMTKFGLLGLAAVLALYLVPGYYFLRAVRSKGRKVRATACMGLSLCLGFMVLGMTDVLFLWWEVFPFYALSVALFTACIAKLSTPRPMGQGVSGAPSRFEAERAPGVLISLRGRIDISGASKRPA